MFMVADEKGLFKFLVGVWGHFRSRDSKESEI